MIYDLVATARDLGRLGEIAGSLIRYGFGDAAQRLGLAGALERAGRVLHWQGAEEFARLTPPQRARHVLQELGPAFVKLGQILATRVDLFPADWIAEFEKLQDQAPPSPEVEVRAQLTEDLGAAPEAVFAEFDARPVAAGSIAQVHRARLADGSAIAIKLRRPGIRERVEADLRLLARLAQAAEARLPDLARFRPREIVRRFARTLHEELDLAAECRAAERVAAGFGGDAAIVIPRVHWQWTGERMNVQDYVEGVPARGAALARSGLDRKALAQHGARAMLKMVLEDGFFHADPHPGNLLFLPGNRVAFIDFGMMGHLGERRRDELVQLLNGLVGRDADSVAELLLDWTGGAEVEVDALVAEVEEFIDRYHGVPLGELRMGAMLGDLARLLQEQRLALPPDLALVLKACATLEATGRELDEDFDMVAAAAPFLRAATLARRGPAALLRRGWRAARTAMDLLGDLPRGLRDIARLARAGRLQVHVDVTSLEPFGRQVIGAANRLTLGVVTAALIVGSSIVMTVQGGPTLLGLPFFGLLGFLGAVAGGTWLLLAIARSGGSR